MKLTFCGGAEAVTGANYLLESGSKKILIDCGLRQGSKYAEEENYKAFTYKPSDILAVFVTHAHIDHIGLLPRLVREGFRGVVYSTEPTRELGVHLLNDAESLMEHEGDRRHEPLYTPTHIEALMRLWKGVRYHHEVLVGPFVIQFYDAGHILGSAFIVVKAEGKTIVFSGDLGNMPPPLISHVEYLEKADVVLVESTYGNRVHETLPSVRERLEDAVENTVKQGGVLMIPAFSMERTQDLLYHLHQLIDEGRIPEIPVFLDSPLGIKLTEVYGHFTHYLNKNIQKHIGEGHALFEFKGFRMTSTVEESKTINEVPSPKIIIAGSGMSNGGRILHHERRYLSDPKSTILFVGYQSKGSLGRQILDGASSVTIFQEVVPVRCRIVMIEGYSAHADQPQLIEWLRPMRLSLSAVFVVQGEEEQMEPFAQKIRDELAVSTRIPKMGESVTF